MVFFGCLFFSFCFNLYFPLNFPDLESQAQKHHRKEILLFHPNKTWDNNLGNFAHAPRCFYLLQSWTSRFQQLLLLCENRKTGWHLCKVMELFQNLAWLQTRVTDSAIKTLKCHVMYFCSTKLKYIKKKGKKKKRPNREGKKRFSTRGTF